MYYFWFGRVKNVEFVWLWKNSGKPKKNLGFSRFFTCSLFAHFFTSLHTRKYTREICFYSYAGGIDQFWKMMQKCRFPSSSWKWPSGERREEVKARTYAGEKAYARTSHMYVRLEIRKKRQRAKFSSLLHFSFLPRRSLRTALVAQREQLLPLAASNTYFHQRSNFNRS